MIVYVYVCIYIYIYIYIYSYICSNISIVSQVSQVAEPVWVQVRPFPPTFLHQYDGLATFRVLLFVRFLPALSIFVDRYSSLATFAIFQL